MQRLDKEVVPFYWIMLFAMVWSTGCLTAQIEACRFITVIIFKMLELLVLEVSVMKCATEISPGK